MNVFDLKQNRAKVTHDIRELMDKYDGKEMDALAKESLAKMEQEFDSLTDSITAEEKQIEREKAIAAANDKGEKNDKSDEMKLWAKALTGRPEDVNAFKVYNTDPVTYTLGTGATAGYLSAPMEFREELIKGLDDILFMRQICRNIGSIGAAQSLGFPYRATAASDAEWVAEVAAAPEEQTLTYGQREFKPHRMAKLIKLSKTLVSHSNLAPKVVLEEMTSRIAITQEKAYMTGNGSGKPLGIFTASASGISTARDVATGNTTTAITFDGLIEAKYSLKEQYLNNAQWIMHRDACKMLAKIKDSEGQYVWMPSVREGQPDMLLGHAVHMSEYAPNTYTAGNYVAVFGDFSNYWICDADTLEMQILNELYAVNNQVGYLYNYFGDGAPVLGEAFARVTLAES